MDIEGFFHSLSFFLKRIALLEVIKIKDEHKKSGDYRSNDRDTHVNFRYR